MRVSCLQENLNRALSIVNKAVKERTPLPITKCILLSAEGNRLKLTATNLEITISCQIPVELEDAGQACIPAREFSNLIETFPNDVVYLQTLPKNRLSIECSNSKNKLAGMSVDDFPPSLQVSGTQFELAAKDLRLALSRVIIAASGEETRPVLSGVEVKVGQDLSLAAADGFQLAVEKIASISIDKGVEIIIPSSALGELNKLLGGEEEKVLVTIGEGRVHFALDNVEMQTQLLTGSFPKYQGLLGQDFNTRAEVKSSDFLRATRRAAIVTKGRIGNITLSVKEGGIVISASSSKIGDSENEVGAELYGQPLVLSLNSKYLIKVLSAIGAEKVMFCGNDPNKAIYIIPIESGDYTYVLMPMVR